MAARILGEEHAGVESSRRQPPVRDRVCPGIRPRSRARAVRGRRGRASRGRGSHAATRPGASNLFRDQLDRYGELELVAERWREAVASLPVETTLVVNADDPVVADLADERACCGSVSTTRAPAPLQHAADSKYCIRCGTPYEYAAAYVGLGDYRCPACEHARPPLDVAARRIELRGLIASRFRLETPAGAVEIELACRACTTSTTPRQRHRSRSRSARRCQRFAPVSRPSARPSGGSSGSRPEERPSSCFSSRTRPGPTRCSGPRDGVPGARHRAQRRDRGRPGRLVDLGRRLRAGPRARGTGRGDRRARRRARVAARVRRLSEDRLEVEPSLERALDRGLELVDVGTELVILPTYTAMLALREILTARGLVRPYWEGERR